jgi:NADH-quinone oxidoreductase subunit A
LGTIDRSTAIGTSSASRSKDLLTVVVPVCAGATADALSGAEVCVLAEYFPVLLFMVVSTGVGVALLVIGNLLGPRRPTSEKNAPYECGFEAFEDARMKFDVRYYLIAILFIIFDLEIAFVLPWATVFSKLGLFGLIEMGMFLGLLVLGFVYVWKKGALEWE